MLLGHEAAGEVVQLGTDIDVEGLVVGSRVILVFVPSCGNCSFCAVGRPALCTVGATANTQASLTGGYHRLFATNDDGR